MNWVDTIITGIFGINIFQGFRRGFILSFFDILSVVLAVIFSLQWFKLGIELLTDTFKISEPIAYAVSFVLTWIAVYCVISLIGSIIHKFLAFSFLKPLDIVGGGFLGALKGIIFATIIFIPLSFMPFLPENIYTAIENSVIIAWAKPSITKKVPGLTLDINSIQKSVTEKAEEITEFKKLF